MSVKPQIKFENTSRYLQIHWSDNQQSRYPYVWLRHQARFHRETVDDTSVKIDLIPDELTSLSIDDIRHEDNQLFINWHDSCIQTHHDLDTLKYSGCDSVSRSRRKHQPKLWDASCACDITVFDFKLIDEPKVQLELLLTVADFGFARIRNVPIQPGTVKQLAELFGTVCVNNYGEVFDVRTSTNVNMGSNTGKQLALHTDENYRHNPPGISFFHCLAAADNGGGESTLVDGFAAAQHLKHLDAKSYQTLCHVPVQFQRLAGSQEDMRAYGRIIATDIDGDVVGIRFSDRTIPPQDLPEQYLEPVYCGIRRFWKIVNSEKFVYQYLMQPGDLHIFDNQRVLHGRTAFDPKIANRHLQQCSVNRDEFHNTLRLKAAKFNKPAAEKIYAGGALG